ncbi:acyl-CoA dehydrogenase [Halobacteriales archaeon QS_8_69_73]|nr:MAG: acyl-CoA dehydrogenase [Halobacteriales archaeon QS_8_69_73]
MEFGLTEEQERMCEEVRRFADNEIRPHASEYDREEKFPHDVVEEAAEMGLCGATIPVEYGGAGYDAVDSVLIAEELFAADPGIGLSILAASFGTEAILEYGTEEQKERFIEPVARGEAISGAAISEPDTGSDVSSVSTSAEKDGDEWVIDGHKKITGKMGIRASDTAELILDEVRVPEENLVGSRGAGFLQQMQFFDATRTGVAAQGVGIAKGAAERALEYAEQREQFGRPIGDFQAIQHKLADMHTETEAARQLTLKSAWAVDSGGSPNTKLASMAKEFASRVAVDAANECVQIHGGSGFVDDFDAERLYRDAKITQIYEGTTEIQKMIIARELQGKGF